MRGRAEESTKYAEITEKESPGSDAGLAKPPGLW
jgi:hypothetical protein